MNTKAFDFFKQLSYLAVLVFLAGAANAAQTSGSRSAGPTSQPSQRTEVTKANATDEETASRAAVRRTTTSNNPVRISSPQGVVTNRAATRQTVYGASRSAAVSARSDTSTVARSATTNNAGAARSATVSNSSNVARGASQNRSATSTNISRAASARATAVFDDISKIGGGYANCREAYSTCMDQFCAKANDTYRRCFCSSKFTEFRDTENALDEAKTLLMRFEDNNLNAVDKTAAEVSAMYSATVGEKAIKNDTSGAASILAEISDLLSGKKKASTGITSLSGLTLDFTAELGDIWGDNSGDGGIFSFGSSSDLSKLEGQELYNSANKQCSEMIKESCENNSVFTMARSSYNIFITQDCNLYEKKINTQKEAVTKTVREAEKILREARLEEYRAHNSADVNECITNVKNAITGEMACGANYKKCLDYTGSYINANTGEPIYSQHLFKLLEQINLNLENGNVIQSNSNFNRFLDGKKMFAESALDTCRDKATIVWEEFKRSAIIEIAQAQDAKIEEVKNTCVDTMKECYDTQSGALASFDNTTAQATGALNAYAAKAMCAEKVTACAALYAPTGAEACQFDASTGRLKNPGCGMTALLAFVGTVDNYKVAEGCEVGMRNFVESTCAPAAGDSTHASPWGCRLMPKGESDNYAAGAAPSSIYGLLQRFALDNCTDPSATKPNSYNEWNDTTIKTMVDTTLRKILEDIDYVMYNECDEAQGLWVEASELNSSTDKPEQAFYTAAFGGKTPNISTKAQDNSAGTSWGYCVQNNVRYQCIAQDEATGNKGYAVYNAANNTCTFTDEWYQIKCEGMGGYYEGGVCYV